MRNAIGATARLMLVEFEARRITGFRNDTNLVRIISIEWQAPPTLAHTTQPAFAVSAGVPVAILRQWEHRQRQPRRAARALLALLNKNSCLAEETLGLHEVQ